MTHLSDDNITEELKSLGKATEPSNEQKRNARHRVFEHVSRKSSQRPPKWVPVLVSFIVFLSLAGGLYAILTPTADENPAAETAANDVTESWRNVYLLQTSETSPSKYSIKFTDHVLIIQDVFPMNQSLNEANGMNKTSYPIAEPLLPPGEFEDFRVEKDGDRYTLHVPGEQGFTYQLTKIAPRKYVGEEDIEYNTPFYIDGEPE